MKRFVALAHYDREQLGLRFWPKVQKADGCWLWQAALNAQGYGKIQLRGRITMGAHRIAYYLTTGVDPGQGLLVCHTCDNPPCCNPEHLFLGTYQDNRRDCVNKRRHGLGAAKITRQQAREIQAVYAERVPGKYLPRGTCQGLMDKYGLNRATICRIGRGGNWKPLLENAA